MFSSERRHAGMDRRRDGRRLASRTVRPRHGQIGPVTTVVGTPVGAVDAGLLVSVDAPFQGTEFKVIDRSGRLQHGPVIDSAAIDVLAPAGTTSPSSVRAGCTSSTSRAVPTS